MDRYECRDAVVEQIRKDGRLIKIEDIVHQVGHSERSHCVVEPMLMKQWFIKMRPLAEQALRQSKVNIVPERFNHTFRQWMENVDDWCISRQLWWGHRIPAYYHKETGEIIVSETPVTDPNSQPESRVYLPVGGNWQDAACRQDGLATHDDCAIVKR